MSLSSIGLSCLLLSAAEPQLLKTPAGVRYAMLGEKKDAPAPILFILATGQRDALASDDFARCGKLLLPKGCLCVSLDLPCHGEDVRKGEPAGLDGWRARLDKGESLFEDFAKRASAVVDHLVKEKIADPERIGVAGTSRGGFTALHWAAVEPRVGCVVAFAPMSDPLVLREFQKMDKPERAKALSIIGQAGKLADRPIWMCIGNKDARVGTDALIAFSRKLASESKKMPAPSELHIMPTLGHRTHDTAHEEAAAWLGKQWKLGK